MTEKAFTAVAGDVTSAGQDQAAGLVSSVLAPLVSHVFTTRVLSFRGAGASDDYGRLAAWLGLTTERLAGVRQVHGRHVLVVRPGDDLPVDSEADAIVSTDPARAIMVRIADCVPILLADRTGRVVAAVHAGWRGTVAGVAGAAVEAMSALGTRPADLVAAMGPSIGACCYQVDVPVRDAFAGGWPGEDGWFAEDGPGRWRLDLWRANADQLVGAGVSAAAIHQARLCTAHHPERFHSYRRDGAAGGRMVAAIRPGRAALRT